MYQNRLSKLASPSRTTQPLFQEYSAPCRLARPRTPEISAASFVLFPLACLPQQMPGPWALQQWIYQQAFEQAQAVACPSLPERDLLGVWN